MGCTNAKEQNTQKNRQDVRRWLQEIEQIIKQVESLNCFYQDEQKIACNISPQIEKIEEFIKYAFQNYKSESIITQATIQQKITYDSYASQLKTLQQNAIQIVGYGTKIYVQKQNIDKSPVFQAFGQKLMILQDFAFKVKIPQIQIQDLESKLQNLVKCLSLSQSI
ncbi:hypothetical protein ABPG72_021582 [Tetrahymena utriculariae]